MSETPNVVACDAAISRLSPAHEPKVSEVGLRGAVAARQSTPAHRQMATGAQPYAFSCVSIASTLSIDHKFHGAATAANGRVVFAPLNADCVGVFDAASDAYGVRERKAVNIKC